MSTLSGLVHQYNYRELYWWASSLHSGSIHASASDFMLQLAPSSHVQHPHAAHQSHGSIPRSRCRIEFSHEYDTLCRCRTEEWPSIRKVYIKKIKQTSKSKAEVDLVYGATSHTCYSSWFFWYTQNWFMFIQLFYLIDRYYILAFEWFYANICLKQVTNVSFKSTKMLCWSRESFFIICGWWWTSKLARK